MATRPIDQDFFGVPVPIDVEETQRFLNAIEVAKQTGNAGVRRAEQETARLKRYGDAAGIDPVPERSDSTLYNILDTLDTPRQAIAGAIANLTGFGDYGNESFLGAIGKATDEDLTTGEMLRVIPGLDSDEMIPSVVRGGLGLIGDIVTDPITYVNPFGAATKVGMKGLSATGKVAHNKLLSSSLKALESPQGFASIAEKLAAKIPGITQAGAFNELPEALQGKVLSLLDEEASVPFKQLAIQQAAEKSQIKAGLLDVVPEEFKSAVRQNKEKIASQLGITDIADLDSIFAKPRVTITGPFAGGSILGQVPLLGANNADIPIISDLSAKFYTGVGDTYYGAKRYVKEATKKGLEENPESLFFRSADLIGDMLSTGREKLNKAASLFSLRAAASGDALGSNIPKQMITEAARAKGALFKQSADETDFIFRHIPKELRDNQELMKKISHTIERNIDGPGGYQQAINALRSEFEAVLPGSGEAVVKTVDNVKNLFDELADTEQKMNLLGDDIKKGYVYHMYGLPDGMDDIDAPQYKQIADFLSTPQGTADLSLRRSVKSLNAAKALGLSPEENIIHIANARLFWHHMAVMEKDYAERFISQWAISPEIYKKLGDVVREGSDAERKVALKTLNNINLKLDPESAFAGVRVHKGTANIPLRPDSYNHIKNVLQTVDSVLSPEEVQKLDNHFRGTATDPSIDDLIKKAHSYDTAYSIAKEQQVYNNLSFSKEEANTIQTQWDTLLKTTKAAFGRDGEFAFARAGTKTLEDAQLKKLKNLSEEDRKFWGGLLPQNFYDAWEDSQKGYGLLRSYAEKLKKQGVNDPMKNSVFRALKLYDWHHKRMKAGATVFWPAYFLRNIYSGLAQGLESATVLGEQFSIPRMVKNFNVMKGADLVTDSGRVLTNKQLMAELAQHGMNMDATAQKELLDEVLDLMPHSGDSNAYVATVPDARRMLGKQKDAKKLSRYGKLEAKMSEVSSVIEAKGRQHLYLNLRAKGYDAASASAEVNRLLIDYSHGKTAFERQILNNAFFFYSFSRGNMSNMFHAMVKKPGALTSQLHIHKGIAEALSDPSTINLSDEDKLAIQTNRSKEMLSTFLGENAATGLPRILEGTGMPVEEVGKWLGAFEKPASMKWGDLITAFGKNTQKTALNVFAQANPVIKGVVEVMANKNFFFDRPLTDETLRKIPSWEKDTNTIANYAFNAIPDSVWKGLDDVTKAVLDGRSNPDGTITINPYSMATISYLVPIAGRFISTRSTLTELGTSQEEKLMRLISGIKVNEVDPAKSLAYDERRRTREYYETKGSPLSKRQLRLRRMAEEEE